MASWMVHFRLAENLLHRIDGLDTTAFALGNIGPDSGIPDAEWKTFTPPTEVTHFHRGPGIHSDLDFYRGYLKDVSPEFEPVQFSFRLGYFFHIATDNLWHRNIGEPTRARFAAEFDADPDFIWEVKRDWYGLDFCYLRDHGDFSIWRAFLSINELPDMPDFLPAEALRQKVDYIQTFYQRNDEGIQALFERPYIYLSQADMDRFVDESADRLYTIYDALWVQNVATGNTATAIDLPIPA
jgi:hypothetical protein